MTTPDTMIGDRPIRSAGWVRICGALAALLVSPLAGCSSLDFLPWVDKPTLADPYIQAATAIEYPKLDEEPAPQPDWSQPPITLAETDEPTYQDITLEEAIHSALANSKIIRDIGGVVVRSPQGVPSTFDVALRETDPRFGVEAALSEYDAHVNSSVIYEDNDRVINNVFLGGITQPFRQRTSSITNGLSKRTAVGGELFLRNNLLYNQNNAPTNVFSHYWDSNIEMGFRQSLLQGAGAEFNRIAGPSGIPGVYQGVLIARTNVDISIADFEIAVRNLISDVENAYWDLYFSYRDLNAKVTARDTALATWRRIKSLEGQPGGERSNEAQAREQYYHFQEEVQIALTGRLLDTTRSYNGSPQGTFRNTGGVHVAERRLRYLAEMPINTGTLLRPKDEPIEARIMFDWNMAATEAMMNRPELRRQKWVIKQRELELVAARNFLKPQLDMVGLYRWRGFGKSLLNPDGSSTTFGDSVTNLMTGDYQEWQLGAELSIPIGYRRAHAGVRNAEFQLIRDQALLREAEHLIMRDLSNAYAEVDRSYGVLLTVLERWKAAQDQLNSLQAAYEQDRAPLNLVLDAQRRAALTESRYYEALIEYTLAIKGVQFEKGTLLAYENIHLSEGPWSEAAHENAIEHIEQQAPVPESRLLPDQEVISTTPGLAR